MIDRKFLTDWLAGTTNENSLVLRSGLYEQMVSAIQHEFDVLDETSSLDEILERAEDVYAINNAINVKLGITHPACHDDVLIYYIAEELKNRLPQNHALSVLNVKELAECLSERLDNKNVFCHSASKGRMYTIVKGEFLAQPETLVDALNEMIFRANVEHEELAKLCGFSCEILAELRSGRRQVSEYILLVFAFALSMSSIEFSECLKRFPEENPFNFQDEFSRFLISELDLISVKRLFPEISNLSAIAYIQWLKESCNL